MSFQDVGPGALRRVGGQRPNGTYTSTGGFGAIRPGGPVRTGGVGVNGGTLGSAGVHTGGMGRGSLSQRQGQGRGRGSGQGSSSPVGKVGEYLVVYSQNVTMLHRMVQQLGSSRDTPELRRQYHCQVDVVKELGGKIEGELQVQQSALAQASRQEAARLGATHSKLSKDYKRVNTIVEELINQATRRMEDTDSQRKGQEEALMGQDLGQDLGQGQGYRGGSGFGVVMGGREGGGVGGSSLGQQTLQMQMQEEAINTAIIQETEEELQNINQSLYKVNEIFRDLASIVESQQEQVEHIEINTEAAHARAQQGLAQVQKANEYQPSCVIS